MVPRHKIDISAADLLFALLACVTAPSHARDEPAVLDALGIGDEEGLACLSVRSGFDLLVEALALPAASEVLVSAVTHLDLVRILERHGIVAVPVDLDAATLAPRLDLLELAVTRRTRAIVVAHLFGGTVPLAPIASVARRHGLLLVEDCAQSLGASPRGGDRLADVSMFSLGPIKTGTALGGAVLRVADSELLRQMRALQLAWPVQRRSAYAARVTRFAGLAVLARPAVYGVLARLVDLDRLVAGSVRGFPDDDLFERLRVRPSPPLLATMQRRLRRLDSESIAARARAGEALAALLAPRLGRPGGGADRRTHWVFPIVAPDPTAFVTALRRAGFDAAGGDHLDRSRFGAAGPAGARAARGTEPDARRRLLARVPRAERAQAAEACRGRQRGAR
jgi:perosamine synthetase